MNQLIGTANPAMRSEQRIGDDTSAVLPQMPGDRVRLRRDLSLPHVVPADGDLPREPGGAITYAVGRHVMGVLSVGARYWPVCGCGAFGQECDRASDAERYRCLFSESEYVSEVGRRQYERAIAEASFSERVG